MNKIIASIRKHGNITGAFVAWRRMILGVTKLQDNVDTLYYLLNEYVDITQLPKSKNQALRLLQLCDTELLRIFDDICSKYNLAYWMYGGTLLGAFRHSGFIPWDDDTDICMPREDFNRAIEILPELLGRQGIDIIVDNPECPMVRFGIGYQHEMTGVWVDVFPVDSIHTNKGVADFVLPDFIKIGDSVRTFYNKKKSLQNPALIDRYKRSLLGDDPSGKNHIYYDNMEFKHHCPRYYSHDEIFPLKRVKFEGYLLSAPHNQDAVLSRMYKDYMAFPRSGVAHHGSQDNGSITEWARLHSIDMEEVLSRLKSIYIEC